MKFWHLKYAYESVTNIQSLHLRHQQNPTECCSYTPVNVQPLDLIFKQTGGAQLCYMYMKNATLNTAMSDKKDNKHKKKTPPANPNCKKVEMLHQVITYLQWNSGRRNSVDWPLTWLRPKLCHESDVRIHNMMSSTGKYNGNVATTVSSEQTSGRLHSPTVLHPNHTCLTCHP